jgi:membrane-associated phospholipid phosphatase
MYKYYLANFKHYLITQFIVTSSYYLVSKFTPFSPVELELTAVDRFFKPNAWAVWIYMSFFLIFIAGVTFTSKENSIKCCKAIVINSIVASLFFIFFPTRITYWDYTPYLDQGSASYALMYLIKQGDDTSNCLPSLHISNSLVACFFLIKNKKPYIQALSISWMLAIVWSVLSTKQHILYDVLSGTVLAFTSISIVLYFLSDKAIHDDTKLESGI